MKSRMLFLLAFCALAIWSSAADRAAEGTRGPVQRRLYVAVPGVRNYLEYGGHGLLVYAMDEGHRLLKRIPTGGLNSEGQPLNVKGICASVPLQRVFISTPRTLMAVDIVSEKLLWEKEYPGGCDRMAITPNGRTMYVPSFEGDHWHVVNAEDGEIIQRIVPKSGAHNTICGPGGTRAYLAGLRSPWLTVVDCQTHEIVDRIGPFSASIRPFTINGAESLCFVNINELLGFEIGDLQTKRRSHRVEVSGFTRGTVKRHGCPSHGVALTPDEKEIWLTDAANSRLHIFDNSVMPPRQTESILLKDQPGWITFSIRGDLGYPSTGDVVDARTHKIAGQLRDENGKDVQSEKMVEIDFAGGQPVQAGDQFGIGQKKKAPAVKPG